jgi:hypothetical protein
MPPSYSRPSIRRLIEASTRHRRPRETQASFSPVRARCPSGRSASRTPPACSPPATPSIRPGFRDLRTFDLTPESSLQVSDLSALLGAIGSPLQVTGYFLQEARRFFQEAPDFSQEAPDFSQEAPGFSQEAPGFSQEPRALLARSPGTSRKKPGHFLQEPRTLLARSPGTSRKNPGHFSREPRTLLARTPGTSRKNPERRSLGSDLCFLAICNLLKKWHLPGLIGTVANAHRLFACTKMRAKPKSKG